VRLYVKKAAELLQAEAIRGMGLHPSTFHPSTFQLNLSAFPGKKGARRDCVARGHEVLGGV